MSHSFLLIFARIYKPLVVCIFLGAAALQAREPTKEASPKAKANFRPFYWHVNAKYINDFQNINLFINMDDFYTYGAETILALNNWEFFFQYRSLTDRYVSKTRIDEMQIGLRYILGNLLNPNLWRRRPSKYNRRPEALHNWPKPFYLGITFQGSYFQAGNILGQNIQNELHKINRIPTVEGRYLNNYYTLSVGAEVYFSYTTKFKIPSWQYSYLELGLSYRGGTALGYQENFSMGLRSKLYSGNHYLQLDLDLHQLGYYNGFGREDTVEKLWSEAKTALWLAFSSRSGLFQRRVDLNFGSLNILQGKDSQLGYSFGFGSLEFSWAHLTEKRDFREADFSHSLLFGLSNGLVLDRFAFCFLLADRIPADVSFVVLRNRYGDPKLFNDNPLARKAEAIWFGIFHLRPTLDLKKLGSIEFFAGVGAGLLVLEFLDSIDVDKPISPRSSFQYFTIAGQAGLRWYGLSLRRDGAVYGVEASLLSYLPFGNWDSNLRFNKTEVQINLLKPSLHILVGITILTDW